MVASPSSSAADVTPLVVLFDGGCPLCRREIAHYRRLAGAESVDWVDIETAPNLLDVYGVSHAAAMARFHVRGPSGDWSTGVDGFLLLWSRLRGYRWLARVVTAVGIAGPLEALYRWFARRRLRSRCADGSCQVDR